MKQALNERQDYETPFVLFDALNAEFGPLEIDLAARKDNTRLAVCFTPEQDSLAQDWSNLRGWLNPPYGREIKPFIYKAAEAAQQGALIVALLPARTDTAWWQDNIWDEKEGQKPWVQTVRFLRGRPKFEIDGQPILDPKTGKPASGKFPSAVVVFGEPRRNQDSERKVA